MCLPEKVFCSFGGRVASVACVNSLPQHFLVLAKEIVYTYQILRNPFNKFVVG